MVLLNSQPRTDSNANVLRYVSTWLLYDTHACCKSCIKSAQGMCNYKFSLTCKMIKNVKTPIFTVFSIIERWFFKGIHRKNKKVKTVFASILIPKCVFSKTKIQNILNRRVQFIMKITIFRKIKKSCNTKTLWNQIRKI